MKVQLLFAKIRIEVSHFSLKYFFAKVAKETKSPTVGVKFLNASMPTFFIVSVIGIDLGQRRRASTGPVERTVARILFAD